MRYLNRVPEDFLRAAFAYDPTVPSCVTRLNSCPEHRERSSHVFHDRGRSRFHANTKIEGVLHQKTFSYRRSNKSETQAESEARAWVTNTINQKQETPRPIGTKNRRGYWRVCITYKGEKKTLLAHRLVFLLCTDMDIKRTRIDHKDCNPSNNNFENLRPSTSSQNNCNRSINKNSKTGVKGLHENIRPNRFAAEINFEGVKHLKYFHYGASPAVEHKESVKANAIAWLRETRERLHGDYANHGDEGSIAS